MQRRGYKGTSTLMLPMMIMMITMPVVEMKRVLRVWVTMMKFRTCLHKEGCNVFSGTVYKVVVSFTARAITMVVLSHAKFPQNELIFLQKGRQVRP